ncbi:MAG: peptidoglycan DD-metalloendopeptidase family protein, partial [Pseudomonadota bacterium]
MKNEEERRGKCGEFWVRKMFKGGGFAGDLKPCGDGCEVSVKRIEKDLQENQKFLRQGFILKVSFFALLILLLTSPPAFAAVSNGFDYPVGKPDGTDWLTNNTGLQWLDLYNYGSTCGNVYHPGRDFNKGSGDADRYEPVYAVSNGEVVGSSWYTTWGNVILIKHVLPDGSTVWSQYGHLEERSVSSGTVVTKGDQIGTVGKGDPNAGMSAHLHFEIRKTNLSTNYFPCGETSAYVSSNYYNPTDFINTHRNLGLSVTLTSPTPGYASSTVGSIPLAWTTTGDPTAYRFAISTSSIYINNLTTDNDWSTNCDGVSTCYTDAYTSTAHNLTVNRSALLTPGKKFYWRMRVAKPGFTALSAISTFSVRPTVALSLPASNTYFPPGGPVTLSWTSVGATGYRYIISSNQSFIQNLLVDSATWDTDCNNLGTSVCKTATTGTATSSGSISDSALLSSGKTLYWRVRATSLEAGSGISGINFIKITAPTCSYSISPTSTAITSTGGTRSVSVTAATGCAWTASSSLSWASVSPSSGSGNGTVSVTVASNTTGSPRTGTITIAGSSFTISQSAASCSYSISPTSTAITSPGGTR